MFRQKRNLDGSICFKARLVIKGYEQPIFGETFAPVARLTSIRLVLALATHNRWEIYHLDVCTVFLNPYLRDTVYMEVPEGIEWLNPAPGSGAQDSILQLNKALYGLKEAPRLWYQHIDSFLESIGLSKSDNDPNLYYTKDRGLFLVLYVDDILLVSMSMDLVAGIKAQLAGRYRWMILGE